MIDRELTEREKEILEMIRPTTFRDIVEVVRRDVEYSKYDAKRELRDLRNGIMNRTINGDTEEVTNVVKDGVITGKVVHNVRRDTCEVLV